MEQILKQIDNITQSIIIAYERKDWGYALEQNKKLINLKQELKNYDAKRSATK